MTAPVYVLANTPWARLRGLLGRRGLAKGEGMRIVPCNAIHTLGMRFAIDARFYDRHGRLVRECRALQPGRFWVWGGWCAYEVLECAAGDATFAGLSSLNEAREVPRLS